MRETHSCKYCEAVECKDQTKCDSCGWRKDISDAYKNITDKMIADGNLIKAVLDDGAKMPTRAHDTDAGLDMYSREDVIIFAHSSHAFETGVHLQIPKGYYGKIEAKSGLMQKDIVSMGGVIDSGYTGSIRIRLHNFGTDGYTIHKGDKIAQIVLQKIITPAIMVVGSLEETDRGDNGFGSTGK